jgi:hypothetical protein
MVRLTADSSGAQQWVSPPQAMTLGICSTTATSDTLVSFGHDDSGAS